jgi:2-oxoisovalerate dehydrogenase E2 component (dihydrolipoyl transacylase)
LPTTWMLPQLGETVAEATIGRWLKRQGEAVEKFEPLLEVVTEKVTTEITSPYGGVLAEILVPEGATARVGEPLAVFVEQEAAAAAPVGLFPSSPVAAPPPPAAPAAVPGFSPAVRRLAGEYGVDLREVAGTGAGGRVTREDVIAHADRMRAGASRGAAPAPGADAAVAPSPVRRAIAARMALSVREIPHAWMMVEADVTGLVRLRQAARAEFSRREGFDLTYFPFFVKAVVEGLREHPVLNASWTEEAIVYHGRIDLGVAVAAEDGLIVPVLHGADGMSVAGIARAVRSLAARARAGDLGPEDVAGATFTVNNTGALGSVVSMPIIQAPQSGIITLETIRPVPAVVGEGIAIRQVVNLSFSFDHRVADGLTAGRFMQTVRRLMEAYAPGHAVY